MEIRLTSCLVFDRLSITEYQELLFEIHNLFYRHWMIGIVFFLYDLEAFNLHSCSIGLGTVFKVIFLLRLIMSIISDLFHSRRFNYMIIV